MPNENIYTEAHGFKFPNGTTIPIEDAEARQDISEIKQSLSQLENNKLYRTTVTLSSDGNGYAKTDFTTNDYQLVSASGQGFSCFPTDGADGWWYIVFINIATWVKYPNLANKAITITYQEK